MQIDFQELDFQELFFQQMPSADLSEEILSNIAEEAIKTTIFSLITQSIPSHLPLQVGINLTVLLGSVAYNIVTDPLILTIIGWAYYETRFNQIK